MPEHRITTEPLREERNRWFSRAFQEFGTKPYGRRISSSALLLEVDIRIAFCAGAWLSVIALAAAAVEAQFRHVYTEDYEAKAVALYGTDTDLHWLRELRNEILHASKPGSKSSLWKSDPNDVQACHRTLEPEAMRAVSIMFFSVYGASDA